MSALDGNPQAGFWARVSRNPEALGLCFVLPTICLLLFIAVFPLLMQVYLSLTWWTPLDGIPWYYAYEGFIWFEQYELLFTDSEFWGAIWRTVLIMIVVVPAEFFLGLGLAYLFIDRFPGRKLFYSILLTPMMIVPAVVGLMFFLLFQGTGPINDHLGLPSNFSWLADNNRSLIAVMIADIWQWTPLMFLILLAGMLGVPADQLLAAKLLGGSNWQNFRKIIIPRMKIVIIIAIIDQGKLMQYGEPLEVYNEPDNRFVANFVGSPSMNLLEGHLAEVGNEVVLRLAEGSEIPLPPPVVAAFASEPGAKEAILGIRPQSIYLGEPQSEEDRSVSAEVDVIERVGPKRQLHLRVGTHDIRAMDDAAEARPGQRVTLSLSAESCLAFSAADGRRLRAGRAA